MTAPAGGQRTRRPAGRRRPRLPLASRGRVRAPSSHPPSQAPPPAAASGDAACAGGSCRRLPRAVAGSRPRSEGAVGPVARRASYIRLSTATQRARTRSLRAGLGVCVREKRAARLSSAGSELTVHRPSATPSHPLVVPAAARSWCRQCRQCALPRLYGPLRQTKSIGMARGASVAEVEPRGSSCARPAARQGGPALARAWRQRCLAALDSASIVIAHHWQKQLKILDIWAAELRGGTQVHRDGTRARAPGPSSGSLKAPVPGRAPTADRDEVVVQEEVEVVGRKPARARGACRDPGAGAARGRRRLWGRARRRPHRRVGGRRVFRTQVSLLGQPSS